MIRVLALVPFPPDTAPAQRFRIEQWAPHLRTHGIDVRIAGFASRATFETIYSPGHTLRKLALVSADLVRQLFRIATPRHFDAVFVGREASLLGPPLYEKLAGLQRPLVYDFDDAIWLEQEGSVNAAWRWLRAPSKVDALCRSARHVTVGNAYLAEHARRHNPHVTVLPSTVDFERYGAPREHTATDRPTLGWIGSHSTAQYLEAVLPAIGEATNRQPLRLLIVGAGESSPVVRVARALPGLDVEARAWRSEREPDDLREVDIGLMPLPDTPWTRGKCAMKAIQYGSLGIPTIASPVGAATEVVTDGATGRLAKTPPEWRDAILELATDAALRARLGTEARAQAREAFAADRQAPRLAAIFRELVGSRHG